ncbi:MAG: VCBS repeat-containing protein [Bacteroidota bacterium]
MKLVFFILTCAMAAIACNTHRVAPLFSKLNAAQSGINFNNIIDETKMPGDALNEFSYMGGGVGILDVNNDGLKDIFFCGNQVSSKLYLNLGDNHFRDISQEAGVTTTDWITGVSVADINADGYDDLFLCTYGKGLATRSRNKLLINQTDNTFKDEAALYGIADSTYSSQAAFFDFDKDGDLDLFLVNYLLNASYSANTIYPKDLSGYYAANDKLYRNDGDGNGSGHPVFTDVSKEAGIKEDGFGLGVAISDFNNDGWPDIYVSNDFVSNDELWLNNKKGTFTNVLDLSTRHQSYSSMGLDAADINNDGKIDFATLDMMPENNLRKKLSFSFMNYDRYEAERRLGYSPEFSRNMLQLNNGTYQHGDTAIPFFSEIGQMAGISETDWSWSVLMADFNNDGLKDMHITNGIGRDFINADFIQFSQTISPNTPAEMDAKKRLKEKLLSLEPLNLPNYLFINRGDYTFLDASDSAGINDRSISNGAAYADLDNDGDLDLIVNNVNQEAFLFINNTIKKNIAPANHNIGFILKGERQNKDGFGAKIYLYTKGQGQMQEQSPVRGYLSCVDTKIIFGTGSDKMLDSAIIVWPNLKKQTLYQLKTDSVYVLHEKNANESWQTAPNTPNTFLTDITSTLVANYKHTDVPFYDYGDQRLLPQKFSQLGPFISTGDINNDGNTDFYIGGGFNFWGQVFSQQPNGAFRGSTLSKGVKMEEDQNAIFFDANGDGNVDLLVACGDTRYDDTSAFYHPRLYLNDGNGNFTVNSQAIPGSVKTIAGCVAICDYDGDGDEDIFIGGRVSKTYPLPPRSYLLQNTKGVFSDVTGKVCPSLKTPGMTTGAVWVDIDGDGRKDLVIAGEYMPIMFFKNNGVLLSDITATMGLQNMNGMWRSLVASDVDNDGDIDLVAGNLGQNCRYRITSEYPMQLFAKDIDGNGSIDPVMFYYIKDENGKRQMFPSINRDQFAEQVPSIKKSFLLHKDFAVANMPSIFPGGTKNLQIFTCNESRTCWIENIANGKYVKHILPPEAQFAPVNAILCTDIDGDGINDLLLAGNEYQTEISTGRYDASYGTLLKGNGRKGFDFIAANKSGFVTNGDVKDMKMIINQKKEKLILIAVNNDSMRVFKCNNTNRTK